MKNSKTLNIKAINAKVTFKKLSNQEWWQLRETHAPIFEDWDFLIMLDRQHYPERDFGLAQVYTALFKLFGGHNNYDDYKCTFSYKFKLIIKRGENVYHYGLELMDMKGNMPYFTYYRMPKAEEDLNAYQSPLDHEFSKEDMRYCTLTLISFLEGFIEGYQPFFNQNFYRISHAGYLIYGFENGMFFNHFYDYEEEDSLEKFQMAIQGFKNKKDLQTEMSKAFWKDEEV
ncbi:MAG: hypothetical protein ACPG19_15560 [Saprospiraceae bacterium]